jgi:hypothetical protein
LFPRLRKIERNFSDNSPSPPQHPKKFSEEFWNVSGHSDHAVAGGMQDISRSFFSVEQTWNTSFFVFDSIAVHHQ